jgi:hypothetical protein
VKFEGVVISGVTLDKHDAKNPAVKRAKIDLVAENVKVEWHAKK